jgi:hypothetical protein
MPYSIPLFLNMTVLYYRIFTKAIQSNQKLALSQLMYSIHCGNIIFPYHALERKPTQETLTGCARLHKIKNLRALNIHLVFNTYENHFKQIPVQKGFQVCLHVHVCVRTGSQVYRCMRHVPFPFMKPV